MSRTETNDKEITDDKDVARFIQTAMDRFETASSATSTIRAKSLDDIKFSHNDDNYQWPVVIWQERIRWKRPVLVVNQLPKFIRQVTNETRMNRPSIVVHPVDDGADIETAEVIQGLIRHIEYDSDASCAYDTASDFQVRGGLGYIRVVPEYASADSFEQNLKIKRVKNPFTHYPDPDAQEPDYSDARWWIITEDMDVHKYREQYPGSKLAGLSSFDGVGNAPQWVSKDNIRVAEYFYFKVKHKTIYLLTDGSVVDEAPPEKEMIARTRKVEDKTLCWCKFNAIELLEETVLPIPFIPIVPVIGEECDVDGKRLIKGMVRDAQDSQRQYNYMASAQTEAIALAPKSPFVIAEGQIEGYEAEWQNANIDAVSALTYKPTTIGGSPVPPPQRQQAEPPVQAITQARMQAAEDLKGTTGIFDASLGARSNETSGKAIVARQREGDTANYHFHDNLARSIRHLGRILVAWIPHVYDTERTVRILGEDATSAKLVKINAQEGFAEGQSRPYQLDAGTYDVTISVGPSFSTKREQAVESMTQMTQAVPELFKVAGDLLVKNMDWPGAQDLAKRLKLFLPPEVQKLEQEGAQNQLPPQVQQQMAEMGQMIDALTQQLNAAKGEIETKGVENKTKIQVEQMKTELGYADIKARLMIAQMQCQSKEDIASFQAEMEIIEKKMELLHRTIDADEADVAYEREAGMQRAGAMAESA